MKMNLVVVVGGVGAPAYAGEEALCYVRCVPVAVSATSFGRVLGHRGYIFIVR